MVSKASELFPEPESPVTTVSVLRGMRTLMSRRLCWRAPRTEMCVIAIYGKKAEGTCGVHLGGIARFSPSRGILLINRNKGQRSGISATIAESQIRHLIRIACLDP